LNSIQAARIHTGELTVSREDLRDAVRALANALDDLALNYRITHFDDLGLRGPRDRLLPIGGARLELRRRGDARH